MVILSSLVSNIHVRHQINRYRDLQENSEKQIQIAGIIISDSVELARSYRYVVRGVSEEHRGKRFLLYVRRGGSEALQYGDLVSLRGNLEIPDGRRNHRRF